jgi:hypothetical protein
MHRSVPLVPATHHPRPARRVARLLALLTVGATCLASSAAANSTVTQTVGPGGTISTGSDATPADPIKVSVTSQQGGTYRIDTITSPTTRTGQDSSYGPLVFTGPQVLITPPCGEADPGCLPYATDIVIDGSIIAEPGNALFGVIGRNAMNTKAQITAFCSRAGQREAGCFLDDPLQRRYTDPDQPRHTMLPNGDVNIAISPKGEGSPNLEAALLDFGTVRPRAFIGTARTGDIGELLGGQFDYGLSCNLHCTPTLKLSVSAAIARKFHLGSTTIATKTFSRPGRVHLAPSSATRRKLKKAKRLTVTVASASKGDDGRIIKLANTVIFTPAAQDG